MGEYRREVELETADGGTRKAVFEHPAPVRLAHWAITIALPVMVLSGLEIFRAFPSFGPKIPQDNLFRPPRAATLGGWLAGGLEWHVTFAWIFLGAGAVYLGYQLASGNLVQVLFRPRDLRGVGPMVRHYLLRAPRPDSAGAYNPLQKLAYTTTLAAGALAGLTGLCLLQPVQLAPVVALFGGYQGVRIGHFTAMVALVAFVPGHLLMVALHGWNNLRSMATGFKIEAPSSRGPVVAAGEGAGNPPPPAP
jgi:thiosulfate reductase cytochrome b subunit